MKITFQQILHDYLALRGESPDLLPLLEEGEESAVLTLRDQLRVELKARAIDATLATPPLWLDDIREITVKPTPERGGLAVISLPPDYLKFYSLQATDWKEPLMNTEPEESLRRKLGANAPGWMICAENPMAVEENTPEGKQLRVYGSDMPELGLTFRYIPLPYFDGESLIISEAAYSKLIALL